MDSYLSLSTTDVLYFLVHCAKVGEALLNLEICGWPPPPYIHHIYIYTCPWIFPECVQNSYSHVHPFSNPGSRPLPLWVSVGWPMRRRLARCFPKPVSGTRHCPWPWNGITRMIHLVCSLTLFWIHLCVWSSVVHVDMTCSAKGIKIKVKCCQFWSDGEGLSHHKCFTFIWSPVTARVMAALTTLDMTNGWRRREEACSVSLFPSPSPLWVSA